MPRKTKVNFEEALEQLDDIVEELEQGDMELEESLKQFETGVKLIRDCQKMLDQAEQKVKILLEKNGKMELDDFEDEE